METGEESIDRQDFLEITETGDQIYDFDGSFQKMGRGKQLLMDVGAGRENWRRALEPCREQLWQQQALRASWCALEAAEYPLQFRGVILPLSPVPVRFLPLCPEVVKK